MRTAIAIVFIASFSYGQPFDSHSLAQGQQAEKKKIPQGNGVDVAKDAVDFKLKKLKTEPSEKDETVQLSALKGKPVVLVFGSYT